MIAVKIYLNFHDQEVQYVFEFILLMTSTLQYFAQMHVMRVWRVTKPIEDFNLKN